MTDQRSNAEIAADLTREADEVVEDNKWAHAELWYNVKLLREAARALVASPSAGATSLEKAARDLVAEKFETYKARNGRNVGIQDTSGEKCWIVPFDAMAALEHTLNTRPVASPGPQKETVKMPTLYVGTMNDGLFIIDRPPRPAPKDVIDGGDPETNVIAKMTGNDREAQDIAERMVRAFNRVAAPGVVDENGSLDLIARTLFKSRGHGYAPAPHWDQEPNPLREECIDDARDVVAALGRPSPPAAVGVTERDAVLEEAAKQMDLAAREQMQERSSRYASGQNAIAQSCEHTARTYRKSAARIRALLSSHQASTGDK